MQDNLIVFVLVHPFNDIDLAILRPARTNRPKRGPGTTNTPGHVRDVDNVETLLVEHLTFDSYRIPSRAVRI